MSKKDAVAKLRKKYQNVILSYRNGVYIWGTGLLGKFAHLQCEKNNIVVYGFIDNDKNNLNEQQKIFSYSILKQDDIVIIASFYCADIIEQLESMNLKNYIYYEDLSIIIHKFDTYYPAFNGVLEELEANKMKYIYLYDLLEDEISKKIYTAIINYKISLNTAYTSEAYNLSLQNGVQYFDKIIIDRLGENTTFLDVGGFDGGSTKDFIERVKGYNKIYFFEPDFQVIEEAKKKLHGVRNIEFIQAGAGRKREMLHYNAVGDGSGNISEEGKEIVPIVVLDDYIENGNTYVKMDVEGYEMQVLEGMKRAIIQYKPILAVSVYHKCGDMHRLVDKILAWNPRYKIYLRHYTRNYADTVCYFIDSKINM